MASVKSLLTIAIPTFNRSGFLDRALNSIYIQVIGEHYPIELIVSDNYSTDNTGEIVSKYKKKGLDIKYIRNDENKGAEFNVVQCYLSATSQYVVAFGDDDIFIEGSLGKIIKILESSDDYGVVYLNSTAFKDNLVTPENDFMYSIHSDNIAFIKEVSYYTTFISANIVNTKFLDKTLLRQYMGTFLPHLGFIYEAILNAKENVNINSTYIASEPNNTVGYNLVKVFGLDFYSILSEFELRYETPNFKNAIVNDLIVSFFPSWILKLKLDCHRFESVTSISDLLMPIYKQYSLFWLIIAPLDLLPLRLAKGYFFLIRGCNRLRRLVKLSLCF